MKQYVFELLGDCIREVSKDESISHSGKVRIKGEFGDISYLCANNLITWLDAVKAIVAVMERRYTNES